MKHRADFRKEALADIKHLWAYHAERNGRDFADEIIARIKRTIIHVIAEHPHVGRARPEFGGLRSYPIVPNVVFYRIEPDRIVIVRILHGRRDLKTPLISLLVA